MTKWKTSTLGNYVKVLNGYAFKSKLFNTKGNGKPLIRIRDLAQSSIDTYYQGDYEDSYIVTKGDVLIGMDGNFYVIKWNDVDALLNQRVCKVLANGIDIDQRFLYYPLKEVIRGIEEKATGTTVIHLSSNDIKQIQLCHPESLTEQKKIATILSTIDEVIDSTQALIDKHEKLKEGMMHDLFTRGIDLATGKLRPHPDDAPELYKESELGLVPREWEVESLKTLFNIIDGDRGSNYPSQEDLLDESYCAFLSNKNIIDGKVVLNGCQYITETKHRKLGKGEILKGDLVVSTRGTIGNIGLSNNLIVKRINSGMVILRSNAYKCYSGLFLELRIHSFKGLYNKVQSGSAQPQLPIKDMGEFKFILPSKVESVKIIKIIDDVVTGIDVFKIKKKKFLLQKRGLMKDLLSGEVRVSI